MTNDQISDPVVTLFREWADAVRAGQRHDEAGCEASRENAGDKLHHKDMCDFYYTKQRALEQLINTTEASSLIGATCQVMLAFNVANTYEGCKIASEPEQDLIEAFAVLGRLCNSALRVLVRDSALSREEFAVDFWDPEITNPFPRDESAGVA